MLFFIFFYGYLCSFGVLSDGVRKRLAYSWEADMEFEQAKKVL